MLATSAIFQGSSRKGFFSSSGGESPPLEVVNAGQWLRFCGRSGTTGILRMGRPQW
jgi:hypothetical protein